MELDDLAAHKSELVNPISYTYGGDLRVHEVSDAGGSVLVGLISFSALPTDKA
jgi:gamma-glutamyltranspeptidase